MRSPMKWRMALTDTAYMYLPPLSFLALTHEQEPVRTKALEYNQKLWESLQKLEETALKDKRCADFVRALRFPQETFVRVQLVKLHERGFESIPPSVTKEMVDFSNAPKSTWLVENFGNLGRRVARKNGSGKDRGLSHADAPGKAREWAPSRNSTYEVQVTRG